MKTLPLLLRHFDNTRIGNMNSVFASAWSVSSQAMQPPFSSSPIPWIGSLKRPTQKENSEQFTKKGRTRMGAAIKVRLDTPFF
ncbi:MAG: hypothetical protein OSA93_08900 [Akkermansiaceae bacterium]|jgi:hypothetical protein|nr:hypothetical protein [Akkermansiaceae bacterium]